MTPDDHSDPDEFQQAWQARSAQTRVTIHKDTLLKEVQRSQRQFQAMVYLRDYREVVIAILMIPLWFYLGFQFSLPWTWYLTVPALLWTIGFILIDRKRHPRTPNAAGDPLSKCVLNSLRQVEHQIWLLRNVFWWYLLPFTISIMAFFAQVSWQSIEDWRVALGLTTAFALFLLVLYGFVYFLNQYAVRKQLIPQHEELSTLLNSLGDETSDEVSGKYPILMNAQHLECSPRRMLAGSIIAMVILLIGISGIMFLGYSIHRLQSHISDESFNSNREQDPLKRSPFAAIRWEEFQPQVKVGEAWYRLVSIDDVPAEEIVAFSRRTYEDLWQKRFEEDLVELLTRMGHPPGDTVKLVVRSLTSSETQVLEDVPLTAENRAAIRDAAQARESKDSP